MDWIARRVGRPGPGRGYRHSPPHPPLQVSQQRPEVHLTAMLVLWTEAEHEREGRKGGYTGLSSENADCHFGVPVGQFSQGL